MCKQYRMRERFSGGPQRSAHEGIKARPHPLEKLETSNVAIAEIAKKSARLVRGVVVICVQAFHARGTPTDGT